MNLITDAIQTCASGILVIDTKGTIVETNDTTTEMFGYTREQLLGQPIEVLIPIELRNKHRHHIHSFFDSPKTALMGRGRLLEGARKDGTAFGIDIRISSFEKDNVRYGVANIIDLSEEFTMSGLLSATQTIAKIGSWRVDLSTNKAIWSKMVYDIHEIDENVEITVEEGINFYVEEHRPIITACVNRCIEVHQPWDVELKILTASGKEKWVHAIGMPIVNKENVVIALEGTFRDIHENKLDRIERENALRKLKRTEQLANMGHWEWTISPEKIEWSEGLYSLWELDPSSPPPSLKDHSKYIHPEDQERFFSTLDDSIIKGKPYTVDFRMETASGTKHIHAEGTPQFHQDGTLVAFFGTAQDVSEITKTQLKTNLLNTRLTLALDAAKTGVWELDLLTDELSWDDRMLSLYGVSKEQFSGAYDAWTNGLHPDDREASETQVERARAGESNFDTSFRVIWPDGSVHHIRALAVVLTDQSGLAIKMVGVNWDITQEIEQRDLLEASNERYELMAQGSSVGIWDWPDVSQDSEYWSEKFYELLNYKNNEIESSLENFGKLLHPDDTEETFKAIDEHFTSNVPFDLDYRLRTKSGNYRWFKGTGQVSKNEDGKPLRMVGSIQDIHDRVTAATNLSKLNEELMQFSYRTSHDLRAPLTTSKRLAEFIEKDINSGNTQEALINAAKIAQQMERLELLVGDMLDLARAELRTESDEEIDFKELEESIRDRLAWMIEESDCSVAFDISLQEPVVGEKSRYTQIIENLVSNGIKYRNTENERMFVDIKVFDDNDNIHIEIQDNGIGIPKTNQGETFKMFKRFHPAVSTGSGLGLSIVRKHLDILGGAVELDSSPVGTLFKLSIPKKAEATHA